MVAEVWHRRHALQIVALLPESAEDALEVLEIVKGMVSIEFGFVSRAPQRPEPPLDLDLGKVVSLSSVTKGNSR